MLKPVDGVRLRSETAGSSQKSLEMEGGSHWSSPSVATNVKEQHIDRNQNKSAVMTRSSLEENSIHAFIEHANKLVCLGTIM